MTTMAKARMGEAPASLRGEDQRQAMPGTMLPFASQLRWLGQEFRLEVRPVVAETVE